MKKIVLGLAFLGFGSLAMAQEKMPQQPRKMDKTEFMQKREHAAKAKMEQLSKDLNLSAEQAAQIEKLHKTDAENRMKKMKDQQAKMQVDRAEMKAKRDAEMQKILTKDQFAKWKDLRAEREAKMKDGKKMMGDRKFKKSESIQK